MLKNSLVFSLVASSLVAANYDFNPSGGTGYGEYNNNANWSANPGPGTGYPTNVDNATFPSGVPIAYPYWATYAYGVNAEASNMVFQGTTYLLGEDSSSNFAFRIYGGLLVNDNAFFQGNVQMMDNVAVVVAPSTTLSLEGTTSDIQLSGSDDLTFSGAGAINLTKVVEDTTYPFGTITINGPTFNVQSDASLGTGASNFIVVDK